MFTKVSQPTPSLRYIHPIRTHIYLRTYIYMYIFGHFWFKLVDALLRGAYQLHCLHFTRVLLGVPAPTRPGGRNRRTPVMAASSLTYYPPGSASGSAFAAMTDSRLLLQQGIGGSSASSGVGADCVPDGEELYAEEIADSATADPGEIAVPVPKWGGALHPESGSSGGLISPPRGARDRSRSRDCGFEADPRASSPHAPSAGRPPRGASSSSSIETDEGIHCGCHCHMLRGHRLGFRRGRCRRCACPLCGHRVVDGGNGCHKRVPVGRRTPRFVLCTTCGPTCLGILRREGAELEEGRVGRFCLAS